MKKKTVITTEKHEVWVIRPCPSEDAANSKVEAEASLVAQRDKADTPSSEERKRGQETSCRKMKSD